MTSTGMARKVDDLGRIVLPVETRRLFGIHPGDALEIGVAEGAITLRKMERACTFCEGVFEVREFKGKLVCGNCVRELGGEGGETAEGGGSAETAQSPEGAAPERDAADADADAADADASATS